MPFANQNRSIADLLRDVIAQMTMLLGKEAQLARVELSENLSRAALALGLIIGGAVLLIPALVILLEAAVSALQQNGIVPAAAAGIVGGRAAARVDPGRRRCVAVAYAESHAQQNNPTVAARRGHGQAADEARS